MVSKLVVDFGWYDTCHTYKTCDNFITSETHDTCNICICMIYLRMRWQRGGWGWSTRWATARPTPSLPPVMQAHEFSPYLFKVTSLTSKRAFKGTCLFVSKKYQYHFFTHHQRRNNSSDSTVNPTRQRKQTKTFSAQKRQILIFEVMKRIPQKTYTKSGQLELAKTQKQR